MSAPTVAWVPKKPGSFSHSSMLLRVVRGLSGLSGSSGLFGLSG
jgi:hypothetical protein